MSDNEKVTFNIQLDKEVNDELLVQMSKKRNTKVGQITQLILEEKKRRVKKRNHTDFSTTTKIKNE